MKLDRFGHIAVARFYLGHGRKSLAQAKTQDSKKIWQDYVDKTEERIKLMEKREIEYWQSFYQPGNGKLNE